MKGEAFRILVICSVIVVLLVACGPNPAMSEAEKNLRYTVTGRYPLGADVEVIHLRDTKTGQEWRFFTDIYGGSGEVVSPLGVETAPIGAAVN